MQKITNVSALIDQLKILLWDRSKTREELAEMILGLIEESCEEIMECKDCKYYLEGEFLAPERFCYRLKGATGRPIGYNFSDHDFCSRGKRRDSDEQTD